MNQFWESLLTWKHEYLYCVQPFGQQQPIYRKSPESYLFVFQTYYVWKVKNNRYNIIYFRWLQLYLWTNSKDDKILPVWMLKISTTDSVIIFADISPMLVLMKHFAIKHSNPYNWLCRSLVTAFLCIIMFLLFLCLHVPV